MSGTTIGLIGFACLLAMLTVRVHITMAMFVTGAGIYLVMNHGETSGLLYTLNNLVYARVSNYDLAVIPLFMLMGEFIARSGAVTDVYKGINRALKRIPGRLALATVLGNALFSLVTGVSIASAAAFSRRVAAIAASCCQWPISSRSVWIACAARVRVATRWAITRGSSGRATYRKVSSYPFSLTTAAT